MYLNSWPIPAGPSSPNVKVEHDGERQSIEKCENFLSLHEHVWYPIQVAILNANCP